jgi:hypothetical protein
LPKSIVKRHSDVLQHLRQTPEPISIRHPSAARSVERRIPSVRPRAGMPRPYSRFLAAPRRAATPLPVPQCQAWARMTNFSREHGADASFNSDRRKRRGVPVLELPREALQAPLARVPGFSGILPIANRIGHPSGLRIARRCIETFAGASRLKLLVYIQFSYLPS